MNHRLARAVFWLIWSKGAGKVISLLSVLVVARMLTPEDYGLFALATIWTGMSSMVSEMGLGAAIIQFRHLDDAELNACFWLTMTIALSAYLGLYVGAPAIAAWFTSPRLSDVLRVVGLTLPLMAVRVVSDSLLRKRLAFDRVSQADIAALVFNVPIVVGLAWAGAGVWALVAGALIVPLVQAVASFWFARWLPGLRVGGPRLRELLRYSLATLGSRITWAAYQQADVFILGKVSGDLAVGYYSMAKQLALLPVTKVPVLVNQLASPVMAELQDDVTAVRAAVFRAVRLVMAVSLPLCVGSMLVAEDAVRVALTDKWIAAAPLLPWLAVYAMTSSLAVLFVPALMARYRAGFVLRYMLAQLVLMPLAFWAGARWGGPMGVALAWAVAYPLAFAGLVRELLKELEVGWRRFFAQVTPAALAAGVMALVVVLGHPLWDEIAHGQPTIRLMLMVTVGALVYGATFWCVGGPARGEILQVAGWVVGGGRAASDK